MPKATRQRKKVSAKAKEGPAAERTKAIAEGALSRGQRKRQAAKERVGRRAELVAKMERKAKLAEAGATYDLDSLAALLDESQSAQDRAAAASVKATAKRPVVKTNKTRKRVVAAAVRDFQAVLQHPAFQADPLGTLDTHLANTVGAAAASAAGGSKGKGSGKGSKRGGAKRGDLHAGMSAAEMRARGASGAAAPR